MHVPEGLASRGEGFPVLVTSQPPSECGCTSCVLVATAGRLVQSPALWEHPTGCPWPPQLVQREAEGTQGVYLLIDLAC